MARRVVITGLGAITPLGHSVAEMFANVVAGKSGVDRIRTFDARTFPTTFAAEVKDFELSKWISNADRYRKCGVNTRFALAAARQAMDDANLPAGGDRTRLGVYLGCGEGSEDFRAMMCGAKAGADESGLKVDIGKFAGVMFSYLDGQRERELEMHTPAAHLAGEF